MAYSLTTSYSGEALLSGFKWFDGVDPSNGFVSYQNRANAEAKDLFSVDPNTGIVRLGVDHTNAYAINEGRPSIRLESKAAYNHGLFIADFLHMPPSQCGLWPAFWTYGTDWPNGGEVDIIEGVNTAHENIISAHSAEGCTQSPEKAGAFTGEIRNLNCAIGDRNVGCGFRPAASDMSSYGDGFNAANGGVYAMLWDSDHIRVWHFPRNGIPEDIASRTPEPMHWKEPDAIFGGPSCAVDSFFHDMSIVININFCGDYGNAVWGKMDHCSAYAPTCSEFVAKNPQAFANAYWDVRYIDVYQLSTNNTATSGSAAPSSISPISAALPTVSPLQGIAAPPPATDTPVGLEVGGNASATMTVDPSAIKAAVNPAKIGKFSHLGCFGSSTGFQTFQKVKESADMTVESCVQLCQETSFAGIFEDKCFCASGLDADTRATSAPDGGVCDHPCPGNHAELCGGLMDRAGIKPVNMTGSLGMQRLETTTPVNLLGAPARRIVRRFAPSNYLLTVYGDMADAAPPPMAPAKGDVNMTGPDFFTATAIRTVLPLASATSQAPEIIVEHCICKQEPAPGTSQTPGTKTMTCTHSPTSNTSTVSLPPPERFTAPLTSEAPQPTPNQSTLPPPAVLSATSSPPVLVTPSSTRTSETVEPATSGRPSTPLESPSTTPTQPGPFTSPATISVGPTTSLPVLPPVPLITTIFIKTCTPETESSLSSSSSSSSPSVSSSTTTSPATFSIFSVPTTTPSSSSSSPPKLSPSTSTSTSTSTTATSSPPGTTFGPPLTATAPTTFRRLSTLPSSSSSTTNLTTGPIFTAPTTTISLFTAPTTNRVTTSPSPTTTSNSSTTTTTTRPGTSTSTTTSTTTSSTSTTSSIITTTTTTSTIIPPSTTTPSRPAVTTSAASSGIHGRRKLGVALALLTLALAVIS